jgi:endonuclease/exonuclease/phosphatase family metal-dependent hydrolase
VDREAREGPRVKVFSYNIEEGGSDRLAAIAKLIGGQQPDAVALLEATDPGSVGLLAQELQMQVVLGEANDGYHVAWFSRLPIQRSQNHRLATLAKTLLEMEVAWNGLLVRLFATHLASRRDGWDPVDEVPAILEVLAAGRGRPHLLVGDFNALRPGDPVGLPPPGEQKRGDAADEAPRRAIELLLEAGYVDAYRQIHPDDLGYTYPTRAPWLRLDYHFASPELAMLLSGCDIVNDEQAKQTSDHFPIWSAFR